MEALNKLGLDYISKHPEEAIEILTKMIKEENDISNEKVNTPSLEDFNSGNGYEFKEVAYVLFSDTDGDGTAFWKEFIHNKDGEDKFSWVQHSGIGGKASKSTYVSLFRYDINGKKVLFIHPTSNIVNFKSAETFAKNVAEVYGAKFYTCMHSLAYNLDMKGD